MVVKMLIPTFLPFNLVKGGINVTLALLLYKPIVNTLRKAKLVPPSSSSAGQKKIVDTGNLAAMSESCSMDIQTVSGVKNVLFGGEGIFNTVVTGPGKVVLQSMPISSTAMKLYQFMPHPSAGN